MSGNSVNRFAFVLQTECVECEEELYFLRCLHEILASESYVNHMLCGSLFVC